MKRLFKFLIIGLLVIVILFFIHALYITYYVGEVQNSFYKELDKDDIVFKNKLPDDYLYTSKTLHAHLDFKGCFYSKTRNPIAVFKNTGMYYIFLYKLPIQAPQSIQNMIKEDFSANDYTFNTGYWELLNSHINDKISPYSIIYKQGGPQKNGNAIYLDVEGTNNSILKKNDSVAVYRIYPKSFSIRYAKTSPKDFYGSITDPKMIGVLPFIVEFIKRSNSVYLAIEIVKYDEKLVK